MSATVIEKQGTTLNVCPEGRLDAVRSPMLQNETEPYLADTERIVMDFSKVEYISSAGLRVLMWLEVEMEKRGGEVQVIRANENVLRVFELAGFMTVVHVITD